MLLGWTALHTLGGQRIKGNSLLWVFLWIAPRSPPLGPFSDGSWDPCDVSEFRMVTCDIFTSSFLLGSQRLVPLLGPLVPWETLTLPFVPLRCGVILRHQQAQDIVCHSPEKGIRPQVPCTPLNPEVLWWGCFLQRWPPSSFPFSALMPTRLSRSTICYSTPLNLI